MKITDLADASLPLDPTDLVEVVQQVGTSPVNKKVPVSELGGGGAGSGYFIGEPADYSGALDCDFAGTLGPWSVVAGTAGTVDPLATGTISLYDLTTKPGWLLVQASGSVTLEAVVTLADGAGITVPVIPGSPTGGDNAMLALQVGDGAGAYVRVMLEQDTSEWVVQGVSSDDASGYLELTDFAGRGGPLMFLRIVRSGTTYACFVSRTGHTWQYVFRRTGVVVPYTHVTLLLTGIGGTYVPITAIPFTKQGGAGVAPW